MKVVLCHGSFRYPHYGHLLHFEEAKEYADILVVSITADKFLAKPCIFDEWQRTKMLMALRVVDYVYICREKTGVKAIRDIRPSVYFKGRDYKEKGVIKQESDACKAVGAVIKYTTSKKYSSTAVNGN